MDINEKVAKSVERIGNTPDKLIEILLDVQSQSDEHYVSEEQLRVASDLLGVSLGKAYGTASFYSIISTSKRGRYVIQVCNSILCHMGSSEDIVKAFEDALGIKMGGVTQDGLFSLEYTDCLGDCSEAPAVKINDKVYGNLDRCKVLSIIETLRKEEV